MASLYKPKIISYRLPNGAYRTPDGKRVTKDTPGAVREARRSKKWYGRYTDGAGRQQRPALSESKEISRRMLAKLSGDSQLVGVGIVDPFAEHRGRPLLDHLEDFRRYLTAKGNTKDHVNRTVSRCRMVLTECEAETFEDLQASAVVESLAALRSHDTARVELPPGREWFTKTELVAALGVSPAGLPRLLRRNGLEGQGAGKARCYSRDLIEALEERLRRGRGISTSNHYLTALKGFTRWLVRDGRMPFDPLASVTRLNPAADVRVIRCALPPEQFAALVAAARAGKPFRGLDGADRAIVYTTAANTGLRASELASLTPASLDLDADPPTATVAAAYSKRRRKDVIVLRTDLAEMLRAYAEGRPRNKPLWPGSWPDDGAEMVRLDLAAAGVPFMDKEGRVYDFHALRHQFISDLAAAGVHPKVAQDLARHSTITLTMDHYTHLGARDHAAALEKLPKMLGSPAVEPSIEAKKRKG
jgi:integrase